MFKKIAIAFVTFTMTILSGCSFPVNAVAYNDTIVDEVEKVSDTYGAWYDTEVGSIEETTAQDTLITTLQSARTTITELGAYDDDTTMHDTALELIDAIEYQVTVVEPTTADRLALQGTGIGELTINEYNESLNNYLLDQGVTEPDIETLRDAVITAQENFAATHDMTLE